MELLHGKAIESALAEVKLAAQQLQVTTAAAHELIANVNVLVDKVTAMLDALSRAGK